MSGVRTTSYGGIGQERSGLDSGRQQLRSAGTTTTTFQRRNKYTCKYRAIVGRGFVGQDEYRVFCNSLWMVSYSHFDL